MTRINYHYTKQIFNFNDDIQTQSPLKQEWYDASIVSNYIAAGEGQFFSRKTDHKIYVREVDVTGSYYFAHNSETFPASYATFYLFKMTPLLLWYLETAPRPLGQDRLNFFVRLVTYETENVLAVKSLVPNAGKLWGEQEPLGDTPVYQQKLEFSYNKMIELDAGEALCFFICMGHHGAPQDPGEEMDLFFDLNITTYTRY